MWWIYSLNCHQFPSPTALLCFSIFTVSSSLTLEQPFEPQGRPRRPKDRDTGFACGPRPPFSLIPLSLERNGFRKRKGFEFWIEGCIINSAEELCVRAIRFQKLPRKSFLRKISLWSQSDSGGYTGGYTRVSGHMLRRVAFRSGIKHNQVERQVLWSQKLRLL